MSLLPSPRRTDVPCGREQEADVAPADHRGPTSPVRQLFTCSLVGTRRRRRTEARRVLTSEVLFVVPLLPGPVEQRDQIFQRGRITDFLRGQRGGCVLVDRASQTVQLRLVDR